MGAKIDLIGMELVEGADADQARRLLATLVRYEFVELAVEPDLTPEGARRGLVYCPCDGSKTLAFRRNLKVLRCSVKLAVHQG